MDIQESAALFAASAALLGALFIGYFAGKSVERSSAAGYSILPAFVFAVVFLSAFGSSGLIRVLYLALTQ